MAGAKESHNLVVANTVAHFTTGSSNCGPAWSYPSDMRVRVKATGFKHLPRYHRGFAMSRCSSTIKETRC